MSDQWLSIVEYARQFSMSDMTVRRRIKTGKIHAVLRDGKYYIPMSEALRKMAQHQTPPPPTHIAPPRPSNPSSLVKQHPHADRTYPNSNAHHHSMQAAHHAMPPNPMSSVMEHHPSHLPQQLRQSTLSQPQSVVDSSTLIAFCEGALKKSIEAETRLENFYKERISRLESELSAKDSQIKQLNQQVEDLQLLSKILERKSGSK